MPRKKANMLDAMLDYVTNAPLAAVDVVLQLCGTIAKNRHGKEDPPQEKVVRRVRKVKAIPPDPIIVAAQEAQKAAFTPPSTVQAPARRKRRMRADSAPPASEATPIVPLQEEVGEDNAEAYTGD